MMKERTAGVAAAMVSTGTIRVSLSPESDGCHSGTDTQSKGSQSASSSSDTSEADYRPTADADAAIPKSSSLESETRKVQLFLDNADLDRSRGERRVQPLNRPRPPPPVPQRRVQQERQPAQPRHERRQWKPDEVRNRRSSSSSYDSDVFRTARPKNRARATLRPANRDGDRGQRTSRRSRSRSRVRLLPHPHRRRSRSRGVRPEGTTEIFAGWQKDMTRRPAAGRQQHPLSGTEAAMGQRVLRNFTIANWVVGTDCDAKAFGDKLLKCSWDCLVIVTSSAVAEDHKIYKILAALAKATKRMLRLPYKASLLSVGKALHGFPDVLRDKTVINVTDKIFVALHKSKVPSFVITTLDTNWSDATQPQPPGCEPQSRWCVSLKLALDTTRQQMKTIAIGIVDMRYFGTIGYGRDLQRTNVERLTSWIVHDAISIMTGFFGSSSDHMSLVKDAVQRVAVECLAVHARPFFQGLTHGKRGRGMWVHPSYFVIFSPCRAHKLPDPFAVPDESDWCIGADIQDEMIADANLPRWPEKHYGNADLPDIGKVVMKRVEWQKDWIPDMFQTCMWIGSQYPTHKSQRARIAGGRGNGCGKGAGRGKGGGGLANRRRKGDKGGKGDKGECDKGDNDQSR